MIAMKLTAFFRIIRPLNAVMAGFAAVLAYVIATGTLIPAVLIVFFIVLLITAAGNVINDYHDAAIDAINRPDRPIPSGEIGRSAALIYAILLFVLGNAIGIVYAIPWESGSLISCSEYLPLWRISSRVGGDFGKSPDIRGNVRGHSGT